LMLLRSPDWYLMDLGDASYREESETLEMMPLQNV
jgi:hypothetical protein